jgi:hypothetical protein
VREDWEWGLEFPSSRRARRRLCLIRITPLAVLGLILNTLESQKGNVMISAKKAMFSLALLMFIACEGISFSAPKIPAKPTRYLICNYFNKDRAIYLKGDFAVCDSVHKADLSEQWIVTKIKGTGLYHIKNSLKPDFCLSIEDGSLNCGPIKEDWLSAQWVIVDFGDYVRIQNAWKINRYLNIESGSLDCSQVKSGWDSAKWVMKRSEP